MVEIPARNLEDLEEKQIHQITAISRDIMLTYSTDHIADFSQNDDQA